MIVVCSNSKYPLLPALSRIEDDSEGFLDEEAVTIRHGMTIWKNGKLCWVLRYPTNIAISFIVLTWTVVHHVINFNRYSHVAKMFDYAYPVASILYITEIHRRQRQIRRVSKILDKWYRYPFLDKTMIELKKNAKEKVKRFYYIYYNFMKIGAVSYCLMPIWRYYQNTEKDASNLLLFKCWSPFPLYTWWGFAITYLMELMTIINVFIVFGYIVTFLTAVAITVGYQCRLITIALLTIDERVTKSMVVQNIGTGGVWEEARVWAMKKELSNSVIHYQRIYGLTKEVCGFFVGPISMCYYPGIFALVVCCGRLATERENKFLLFQAAFMVNAILVNQYIIAFINQMITDEFEKLRMAVYDSPWYKMKVPCKKMVHIMQTMMLRKPNIRTILGTNADMEFFATVINASYCYLSALLSTNIKY
ncbi:Odorant receptor 115 [Halyomorpha halys]|nr:Odorant receptor 115 [Halyomorpha halys]